MPPAARTPGPRALARERTMKRIVELGNAQLVAHGVAGLSVREIARGLGMVSSAIYRYVSSRDDLLTLLIVDAFVDLADTVDAAIAEVEGAAGADPRARLLALGDAMCGWALAHPERWTLLYGTPVRDYAAPAETTNADGTRVMRAQCCASPRTPSSRTASQARRPGTARASHRRSSHCSSTTWRSSASTPPPPRPSPL